MGLLLNHMNDADLEMRKVAAMAFKAVDPVIGVPKLAQLPLKRSIPPGLL